MKSYKMGSDWLAEEENCGFKEKKMITVRCRSDRWCCVQSGRGGKLGSWDLAFDVVLLDTLICLSNADMEMAMPFIYY